MITQIFTTLQTVFTQFIPMFGAAFVSMFTALFAETSTEGAITGLNELGIFMVTIVGVAMVIGIFALVFRLFNKLRARAR